MPRKPKQKKHRGSEGRYWRFTNFTIPEGHTLEEALVVYNISIPEFQYIQFQIEKCPTKGKLHHQGWFQMNKPVSTKFVKENFNKNMNFSLTKGSQVQNIKYCTKAETYVAGPYEFGEKIGQGYRSDVKNIALKIKEKGLEVAISENPEMYIKYSTGMEKLAARIRPDPEFLTSTCGIIHWGESGAGKSYPVMVQKPYLFDITKDKQGIYKDQEIFLLDELALNDFRDKWQTIMKMTDIYPFDLDQKFGSIIKVRPKEVYITTNYRPEQIISQIPHMNREAFERRFKFVEFKGKFIKN